MDLVSSSLHVFSIYFLFFLQSASIQATFNRSTSFANSTLRFVIRSVPHGEFDVIVPETQIVVLHRNLLIQMIVHHRLGGKQKTTGG